MAQFARPDGNITQTSFTGGFAEIDEATASDTDFAYGANNTAAELEVSLGNVNDPGTGTGTVRYRIAKTNNGTVDGAGNAVTVTARLLEGTTQIATGNAETATGTWTGYSFTFDVTTVTNWTDLRIEFVTSASGGAPAARRGGAVSWAEVEVPDVPAGTEYTDSATITVVLTASGTEIMAHDYEDSATVYVLLSPSGVDVLAPTETGVDRVAFTLDTPQDRIDHYFRATCSLANGAHTGVMRFQLYQGSSTPIGSVMETSALTGSATQYEFHLPDADAEDFTDYATIEVEFYGFSSTGDPAEFRIHEMELQVPAAGAVERTDSATIYLDLSVTSVELAEFVDAAEVYVDMSVESVEERVSEDTGEVYVNLEPSSADIAEYVEDSTVYFDLQSSGTEVADYSETFTVYLDLEPSGVDVAEFVDSAEAYFDLQASGTEELTSGYTDAETVLLDLSATSVEIAEFVDAAETYLDLQISAIEGQEYTDTQTVYVDLQASGTDEYSSGAFEYTDSATAYFDLQATSVEFAEFIDSAEVLVDLQVTSVELADLLDSAEIYLDLQSSGTELLEHGYEDANTVYLDLLPATVVELFEGVDAQLVSITITPTSVEFAEYSDSATVYFDLQPSSIFVQVDFVLEIVGVTTRWTFQTRPEALLRWALLETRRLVWKS